MGRSNGMGGLSIGMRCWGGNNGSSNGTGIIDIFANLTHIRT